MTMLRIFAGVAGLVLLHGQSTLPHNLADADQLEKRVADDPADLNTRLALLRYYWGASATLPPQRVSSALREHAVWVIEHHPEHRALEENWAAIPRTEPAAFRAADAVWRKHLGAPDPAAAIYSHAIRFYQISDPEFAQQIADRALRIHPGDAGIGAAAGALDALTILGAKGENRYGQVSSFDDAVAKSDRARRARRELEQSSNAAVLGGAGSVLEQQIYPLIWHQRPDAADDAQALSEKILKRAVDLEPDNVRWHGSLGLVYQTAGARATGNAEKIAAFEKALAVSDATGRTSALIELAKAQYDAGNYAQAAANAREILRALESSPSHWNYGNAVHQGNILLGRIALNNRDTAEAARLLLAAGRTKGSPQLDSFGPDWKLAAELLAKGENEPVLAYIELCRKFWKMGGNRLDTWAAAIRAGGVPDFSGNPQRAKPDLIGRAAPALELPKLKGGEITLENLKGKVVLLDFWATWCAPCRAEMPAFQKLHEELGPKDVAILAVDVGEPADTVAEYVEKQKFTFAIAFAERADAIKAYGVSAYPTLVVVDAEGRVTDYLIGKRDEETLRRAIAGARGNGR